MILEREAFLADAEAVTNEVFLWAPHLEDMEIPELARWKIQSLKPYMKLGQVQEPAGLQTLAVGL